MVSKNNFQHKMTENAKRTPHYGLRKLSVGVASVLLSTTLYFGVNAQASTNEPANNDQNNDQTQLTDDQSNNDSSQLQSQKQVTLKPKTNFNTSSTQQNSQGQTSDNQTDNSANQTTLSVKSLGSDGYSAQELGEEKIPTIEPTDQAGQTNGVGGQNIKAKNKLKLTAQSSDYSGMSIKINDSTGHNVYADASDKDKIIFPNATTATGGVSSEQSENAQKEAKNTVIRVTYDNLTGDSYNSTPIKKIVLDFSDFALNTSDPSNLKNGGGHIL